VIVRIMGEGQWRVDGDLAQRLNELDDAVGRAVVSGDEESLRATLRDLAEAVRGGGTKLPDEDLSPSDAIVPPEDLSIDEAKQLLEGEGLIPDLPGIPQKSDRRVE
jgi:chromosome condensin MukBEF complex kleisin-like MukF subunit